MSDLPFPSPEINGLVAKVSLFLIRRTRAPTFPAGKGAVAQ